MSEAQKVRLRVISVMTDPYGDKNEIKNAHIGTYREEGDTIVLEYDDIQDGERAHVELHAAKGRAKMVRKGMTSAQLTFMPGQKIASSYVTLYGEIPVAVDTRRVTILTQENGGCLTLDYDVYMGGEKTSAALMEVTWRV